MLACSLVTRTCLKITRGFISGTFRRLTLQVLSPEKTIALLFENYSNFLMTLLAGLFEMRGCWHTGLSGRSGNQKQKKKKKKKKDQYI